MYSMTLRAFAKINLSLHVKGVRSDGYHEIQTIFQTIDLFDRLTFEDRRGPFTILCSAPEVPTDRTNLVWKAADALWQAAGRIGGPCDARIILDKQIPVEAGLGGGSSDAAATLVGLRRLWKVQIPPERLWAIAAALGADVPYFLAGGTALGLGRGDEIYALEELPPLPVVLVVPTFGVSTRDAYIWVDAHGPRPAPASSLVFGGLWDGPAWPFANDFEPAVATHHPFITRAKAELVSRGAVHAAMSGSGSTIFGVFTSTRAAKMAAKTLQASLKEDARVIVTRFRPRRRS
jgi:4-diphosphocytidyl-2-C-methyl-D-erythritol kinase